MFLKWIKRLFMSALNIIKGVVLDLFHNAEAAIILTLSSIGLTTILAELPFHYALPAFIDVSLVIPVIAILTILLLVTLMSWRMSCSTSKKF